MGVLRTASVLKCVETRNTREEAREEAPVVALVVVVVCHRVFCDDESRGVARLSPSYGFGACSRTFENRDRARDGIINAESRRTASNFRRATLSAFINIPSTSLIRVMYSLIKRVYHTTVTKYLSIEFASRLVLPVAKKRHFGKGKKSESTS